MFFLYFDNVWHLGFTKRISFVAKPILVHNGFGLHYN
jgi:hypothetical protein